MLNQVNFFYGSKYPKSLSPQGNVFYIKACRQRKVIYLFINLFFVKVIIILHFKYVWCFKYTAQLII